MLDVVDRAEVGKETPSPRMTMPVRLHTIVDSLTSCPPTSAGYPGFSRSWQGLEGHEADPGRPEKHA